MAAQGVGDLPAAGIQTEAGGLLRGVAFPAMMQPARTVADDRCAIAFDKLRRRLAAVSWSGTSHMQAVRSISAGARGLGRVERVSAP